MSTDTKIQWRYRSSRPTGNYRSLSENNVCLGLGQRPRCRRTPRAPANGEMECSYKTFLGEIDSSCMFLCKEGVL